MVHRHRIYFRFTDGFDELDNVAVLCIMRFMTDFGIKKYEIDRDIFGAHYYLLDYDVDTRLLLIENTIIKTGEYEEYDIGLKGSGNVYEWLCYLFDFDNDDKVSN